MSDLSVKFAVRDALNENNVSADFFDALIDLVGSMLYLTDTVLCQLVSKNV